MRDKGFGREIVLGLLITLAAIVAAADIRPSARASRGADSDLQPAAVTSGADSPSAPAGNTRTSGAGTVSGALVASDMRRP